MIVTHVMTQSAPLVDHYGTAFTPGVLRGYPVGQQPA